VTGWGAARNRPGLLLMWFLPWGRHAGGRGQYAGRITYFPLTGQGGASDSQVGFARRIVNSTPRSDELVKHWQGHLGLLYHGLELESAHGNAVWWRTAAWAAVANEML